MWAKAGLLPAFVNKLPLEHSHAHSFTWWPWLPLLLQRQFSSCSRDCAAHNTYAVFFLALYRSLPSPALSVVTFSCGFPSHLRDCIFTGFCLLLPSGSGGWCSPEFCPSSSHWHVFPPSVVVPVAPEHPPSHTWSVKCIWKVICLPQQTRLLGTGPMCYSCNSA